MRLRDINKMKGKVSNQELADLVAELRLPLPLAWLSKLSPMLVVALIWCVPVFLSAIVLDSFLMAESSTLEKALVCVGAALTFGFGFILTAGVIGKIFSFGIVEGKFPRRTDHPLYAIRRVYGTAWTQVYYFKPLYAVILAVPPLKILTFWLFGYKGDYSAIFYPDTWIRDLGMIRAGKGVYIANRVCVGTNMCLNDGSVIVGNVTLGDGAMVGHMAMFALGTSVGEKSEIGVNTAVGIRVTIGHGTNIRPRANVNHGVQVGDNCIIGTGAVLGTKVEVANGVHIKTGASIPPGAQIRSQEDADKYFSSEMELDASHKGVIAELLKEHRKHQGDSDRKEA